MANVYLENTDRMEGLGFDLYLQPAIHITNLLPMDVLVTIDVRRRDPLATEKNLRVRI